MTTSDRGANDSAMRHPETIVMRANAPLESGINDCLMLCDLETGDILSLNATARAIWEAIAEPITLAGLCDALQRRFAVDDAQCLQDVTVALSEFERHRFVRLAPPAKLRGAAGNSD